MSFLFQYKGLYVLSLFVWILVLFVCLFFPMEEHFCGVSVSDWSPSPIVFWVFNCSGQPLYMASKGSKRMTSATTSQALRCCLLSLGYYTQSLLWTGLFSRLPDGDWFQHVTLNINLGWYPELLACCCSCIQDWLSVFVISPMWNVSHWKCELSHLQALLTTVYHVHSLAVLAWSSPVLWFSVLLENVWIARTGYRYHPSHTWVVNVLGGNRVRRQAEWGTNRCVQGLSCRVVISPSLLVIPFSLPFIFTN